MREHRAATAEKKKSVRPPIERTWPVMPMRTPEAPSGWNQWVKTDAPLSPAHAMIALATESAVVAEVVHDGSSRRPAGRPCLARYLSATAPLKQCSP